MSNSAYQTAFASRNDLDKYGENKLLLFTLLLRFEIEDIHLVASNYLTDGATDKKCDLVYIDKDKKIAVIAQGYLSRNGTAKEAPANKASDLNTAAAWILSTPDDRLPAQIKSAALELREELEKNRIERIEFWYSHNLPESINVKRELDTVVINTKSIIKSKYPNCDLEIFGYEMGNTSINELYKNHNTPILVSDSLEIKNINGFIESSSDWKSFITTIPATWIYNLYKEHGDKLFSANIRGYLGSIKSDANINNGIKKTAKDDPEHFCVFNNGITAISNSVEYDKRHKKLKLEGMSIVNGAQTTGAIGSLGEEPVESVRIQARFIVCSSTETVQSIIRCNNSQNKVEAPDFRSTDPIQSKLIKEFESIDNAEYLGGRRGGVSDAIKRRPNLLPSSTVGQVLTAFNGDPQNAYNSKSTIWESDALYLKIFNPKRLCCTTS